ncbi:MAG: hypothetical protein ACR2QE_08410 [Acidimicrobiales bacterium]
MVETASPVESDSPAPNPGPSPVRVGGWYILLAVAALVVVMVPVQRLLLRSADDGITDDIEAEVEDFRALAEAVDPPPARDPAPRLLRDFVGQREPSGDMVWVGLYDGDVLAASWDSLGDSLASAVQRDVGTPLTESRWGTMQGDVASYRWLAVPVGQRGVLVVAADAGEEEASASDRVRLVALAGVAALVLGGLVTYSRRRSPTRPGRGSAVTDEALEPEFHTPATAGRSLWLRLVDVGELGSLIYGRLRVRGDGRRWRVRADAVGDVVCDPDQVLAAMIVLADEVTTSTRAGDEVSFEVHDHDGGVAFSVSHVGAEVSPRLLTDVLDESMQAVVEAHDGRVWIEVDEHETSRSLFIPRTQAVGPVFGL